MFQLRQILSNKEQMRQTIDTKARIGAKSAAENHLETNAFRKVLLI
jgi:hypothetical protein